jgi:hypothetical protein
MKYKTQCLKSPFKLRLLIIEFTPHAVYLNSLNVDYIEYVILNEQKLQKNV